MKLAASCLRVLALVKFSVLISSTAYGLCVFYQALSGRIFQPSSSLRTMF